MESRNKLFHAIVLLGSAMAAGCNHAPLAGPEADIAMTSDLALPDLALPDLAQAVCPMCADASAPCCCTPDCQICYPCYV